MKIILSALLFVVPVLTFASSGSCLIATENELAQEILLNKKYNVTDDMASGDIQLTIHRNLSTGYCDGMILSSKSRCEVTDITTLEVKNRDGLVIFKDCSVYTKSSV